MNQFDIIRPVHDMGQSPWSPVLRHKDLPIYATKEFDFFRCVPFNDTFYGKIISKIHSGNLRPNTPSNRHSVLFPNKKTSYWSENKRVAKFEVQAHQSFDSYLMFWAYDDSSSSFPTIEDRTALHIVNGMDVGFSEILYKSENSIDLSTTEQELLDRISYESPDAIVYKSHVNPKYRNFIFFEKGFNKLSLREITLIIRKNGRVNRNTIGCAFSSDYSPAPKSYGYYFLPIAKIRFDAEYLNSDEYLRRNKIYEKEVSCYMEGFKKYRQSISTDTSTNTLNDNSRH